MNASSSPKCELTILMPCLNEAETVEVCISKAKQFLARSGICGEVLIADNGSVDGSQQKARAAGARVVDVENRGYGAALLGGLDAAQGRYVIMGDADDSYDFLHWMVSSKSCATVQTWLWVTVSVEVLHRRRCRFCIAIWVIQCSALSVDYYIAPI